MSTEVRSGMKRENGSRTVLVTVIGSVILAVILIGGSVWMVRNAHRNTTEAAHSVSLLYLDELAGRREQVVEDNLKDNINVIQIAIGMLTEKDLSDLEHMREYQRNMKRLFNLERFAFVDTDGLVYTADEGVRDEMNQYAFNHLTLSGPEISIKNEKSADKKVIIAVPIREKNCYIDGI